MEIIYSVSIFGGVCIRFDNDGGLIGIYHEGINTIYIHNMNEDKYLNLINIMLYRYGFFTDGRIKTNLLTYDILNIE